MFAICLKNDITRVYVCLQTSMLIKKHVFMIFVEWAIRNSWQIIVHRFSDLPISVTCAREF